MLRELRIENLLLIERTEMRFGPGLNVITGETGAGKTVLAHSLDLLMGGRPRSGIVRPGAEEAWVEGSFEVPDGLLDDPALADLAGRLVAALKMDGATGIALEEVEAINIRLSRIAASGAGVSMKKTKAAGDIEIDSVIAGVSPGKA
jgi:DNA repair ATPase RecN